MNLTHLISSGSSRLTSISVLAAVLLPLALHAKEIIFQDGLDQYNGASDTTLYGQREDQQSFNYGGKNTIDVAGVRHGGMKSLGLIQFSDLEALKGVPLRTKIKKATLRLYKTGQPTDNGQYEKVRPADRVIRIHPVLKPWNAGTQQGEVEEGSATYSYREHRQENPQFWGDANQIEDGPVPGVDFDTSRSVSSPLITEPDTWMEWDITPIAQGWINDPSSNHGVFLTALSYYVGAYFASCEAEDPSKRPQLVIEY